MFSQPVVFVIGAGVGQEYKMPLGADLKKSVASAVNFRTPSADQELYSMVSARFQSRVNTYEDAGCDLAKAINAFPSIDEALKWFGSRSEVVDLGKVAIVRAILEAERQCPFFVSRDIDEEFGSTWLSHFLSMVVSGWQSDQTEKRLRMLQ